MIFNYNFNRYKRIGVEYLKILLIIVADDLKIPKEYCEKQIYFYKFDCYTYICKITIYTLKHI